MSALSCVLDRWEDGDVRVVLLDAILEALAAQLVRFDGEEPGDDGHLALAAGRVAHGLAGRLALQVQVGADEEAGACWVRRFRS